MEPTRQKDWREKLEIEMNTTRKTWKVTPKRTGMSWLSAYDPLEDKMNKTSSRLLLRRANKTRRRLLL